MDRGMEGAVCMWMDGDVLPEETMRGVAQILDETKEVLNV